MKLERREFLKICMSTSGYLLTQPLEKLRADEFDQEATHYEKGVNLEVTCKRCPHECRIADGKRGFCRVRENRLGKLYTLVFGKLCAVHTDPIEKKPLFHVFPGTTSLSLATVGCNLRCKFCQNWQISQATPEATRFVSITPEKVAYNAKKSDCKTIAYTYTEPSVFFEYMIAIAQAAKKLGVKNVIHSNGFINAKPLKELLPYITAMNVDLKGFTDDYYKSICQGSLKDVLNSLRIIKQEGVWLELTNLIIPTLNDNMEDVKKMCDWIIKNLGDSTPIHFSRFFPTYKLTTIPPTPQSTLEQAREIAKAAGLKFVYIGNIPGHEGEHTYCSQCQKLLVKRIGYVVSENSIINNSCPDCGNKIEGIWV